MSSIIKVDTIQNQSGANIISESANTITVGASGDTVTIPSGGTLGGAGTFDLSSGSVTLNADMKNTPAFQARLSATQSMSDDTLTKVQCNDELYDTDGCYDNSTNYRFTPTVAGKYFVYGQIWTDNSTASTLQYVNARVYKNSSIAHYNQFDFRNNNAGFSNGVYVGGIIDFNGTTDYAELYARAKVSSGTTGIGGASGQNRTFFGAYRIIGA